MAYTKSYLIPRGDLSLAEMKELRTSVDQVVVQNVIDKAITLDPNQVVVRDTLPATDLGLAATQDYLIAGPGVAGTELQYFNPTVAAGQVIGFFGLGVESAPPNISRVRMTQGAASNQTKGSFQLEQLYSALEPRGYFSEVIVYSNPNIARVMVMPRSAFAANTERLHFLARTGEQIGDVISAVPAV